VKPKRNADQGPAPEGIRRGELLTLRGLMARLGIGRRAVWALERAGLRGVTVGHQRYFRTDAVLDLFTKLEADAKAAEDAPP